MDHVLDRLPSEHDIREQIARNTRENLLLESLLDSVQVARAQREAAERAAYRSCESGDSSL